MNQIKAIPTGFHSITPYLIVNDAADAIAFYKKAFGASESMRLTMPNGKVGYAELRIGDSPLLLADEFPEMAILSPITLGGTPVTIHQYVNDVDSIFKQAIAAGGTIHRPITDQFFGDRSGSIRDPFGHIWNIATRKENVLAEEIHRRFQAMFK